MEVRHRMWRSGAAVRQAPDPSPVQPALPEVASGADVAPGTVPSPSRSPRAVKPVEACIPSKPCIPRPPGPGMLPGSAARTAVAVSEPSLFVGALGHEEHPDLDVGQRRSCRSRRPGRSSRR